MYNYTELVSRASRLQPWQILVASATLAEKVLPVVQLLAMPETKALCERCTKFAWDRVSIESGPENGSELVQAFNSLPERQPNEYSDTLYFTVVRALDFPFYAVERAAAFPNVGPTHDLGFSIILEFGETFDTAADDFPSLCDTLERVVPLEKESQRRLIQTFENNPVPTPGLIGEIRDSASHIAGVFRKLLPTHCYWYTRGG